MHQTPAVTWGRCLWTGFWACLIQSASRAADEDEAARTRRDRTAHSDWTSTDQSPDPSVSGTHYREQNITIHTSQQDMRHIQWTRVCSICNRIMVTCIPKIVWYLESRITKLWLDSILTSKEEVCGWWVTYVCVSV